ncbi:hypothetical protein KBB96_00765 [Luteolibacter ambystomatis]|uniref:Uncharacterized protein n=1 Tax=Luteolibacter ambystomatis TaxID=2824561 RepID=A0A975G993_9BACT|nr:hypothetical protein [Luteolibacter ambystomatis]QUE51444.1 hypothetical protein KBB96_00765 [Luteolibacter ambystomatis]
MTAALPTTRIVMVQILVICIGICSTTVALRIHNYPSAQEDWNVCSVAVRKAGWLLLAIPAAWALCTTRFEAKGHGPWTTRWTIATGVLTIAGLAWFLGWTALEPVIWHVQPLQTLDGGAA